MQRLKQTVLITLTLLSFIELSQASEMNSSEMMNLCKDSSCKNKVSESAIVEGAGIGHALARSQKRAKKRAKAKAEKEATANAKRKIRKAVKEPPACNEGCETFAIIEETNLVIFRIDSEFTPKCKMVSLTSRYDRNIGDYVYNAKYKCTVKRKSSLKRICISKRVNQCLEDEDGEQAQN